MGLEVSWSYSSSNIMKLIVTSPGEVDSSSLGFTNPKAAVRKLEREGKLRLVVEEPLTY
jgi:hypothetical protein